MSDHSIEEELVDTTIEDLMIQNNQKIVKDNFEVYILQVVHKFNLQNSKKDALTK